MLTSGVIFFKKFFNIFFNSRFSGSGDRKVEQKENGEDMQQRVAGIEPATVAEAL